MANERNAPDDLPVSDIMRFFEQRLPEMRCPVCGGELFHIEVSNDIKYVEWRTSDSGGFWPVVVASCAECGHIMPFAYQFIGRWLAENSAKVSK